MVGVDMERLLTVFLLLWSSGLQAEGQDTNTVCPDTCPGDHEGSGSTPVTSSQADFSPTPLTSSPHQGPQCKTTGKADIVMLVDDSSSIYHREFYTILSFVTRIISAFSIGPDRVQIGLVLFSGDPITEWHLNTHQTKDDLLRAVGKVTRSYGDTYIGKALDYILHNNFKAEVGMRADSRKIVVLITDGESHDDVEDPSQRLKDAGIEIYAIGVKDAHTLELMHIASNPHANHLYMGNGFSFLRDIFSVLINNLCNSVNIFGSVRLVDGPSPCSGRIEVKPDQSKQGWSPVSEDNFDLQDAEVVCRELGCGAPLLLQGELYGERQAPMWTKEFQCEGNESVLLDCRRSGSSRKAVGLICSEPVRLVGGASRCAGTLEVHVEEWSTAYGSNWTLTSANIACRELDCGSAVSTRTREESSLKSAWEISSHCVRSGYTLRECVTSGSSSSALEITCSEPVRLVGGASRCAGTLEVKRGEWRPVDGSDWTLRSAAAACKQLDCGSAVSSGMRKESSDRSVWKISSYCVQRGYSLRECVSPGSSSSIAEITCSDSVRLVDGTSLCSGRLEVKSDQSDQSNQWWSSVCEDDFDQQDAEVVCRELGCGAPSVLQGALYGEVEAPMWAKEFQCEGHESALLDCRSSDSARNTCSPVGLTCSEPVRLVGGASRCAGTLEVKHQGDWRPVDYWTLTSAEEVCRNVDCGSAASTRRRDDSSNRSALEISSVCVQSGFVLRECVSSGSSSSSVTELICSDLAAFIIRLVVLLSTLLLFITVTCVLSKTNRGQKPGPREKIRLDPHDLGVGGAEGGPAEEEGAQAAE